MIEIGNIVTFGNTKIELEGFNICKDISDIKSSLPTLFVGYKETEEHCSELGELDFINRKFKDTNYWTTSRLEDRYLFNKDLEDFMLLCENKVLSGFSYTFLHPCKITKAGLVGVVHHLLKNKSRAYSEGAMYYFQTKSVIFGFNTELGEIYNFPGSRIDRFIEQNSIEIITEEEVNNTLKQFNELKLNMSEVLFINEKFRVS